jgi:ABC-type spermidine/putrescine transport system permease subunit II
MFESVRLETDPVISVVSTLLVTAVMLGSLVALAASARSRRAA